MARLKSRPLQRTTKRKSQDRVLRESSRSSSTKRLRLQSPSERQPPPSKKGKKKKGKSLLKKPEDAHLPPELRRAGLMAHMHIPKGKCFGPFNGRIVNKEKSPDKMHFFVSEVGDNKRKSHFFYAHKDEKDKCSWLSRLQSATSEKKQNIVAYNSSSGVCFEAVKDIKAGEELMALFDKKFKEIAYPVSVENAPAVSYITDETGRQIAVVQLDTEVDKAKVYVDPTNEVGDDEKQADEEDDDAFEEEDMEIEDDDDDDDYKEDSVDDGGDDDDDDDRDTEMNKRSTDDGDGVADDAAGKSGQKKKRQKKKPIIKEVTSIDADSGADTTKYCCTHCLEEFMEKEQAQEHSTSRECLSKQFQCTTCTLEFKNASLLQKHKCGGKPKCYICDEEFEEQTQLQDHQNSPPADHLPKCAQCDVQFQNLMAKASHVRSKHGRPEKQAQCPICHKTYQKSYLKEHITSHNASDALKCSECGKTFSSRSNLTKHRKKHLPGYVPNTVRNREKKYCCLEQGCEKRFDSSKALESHLRCHTGERPFECEQCSWKFTQKTHLTRHIKSVHEKVPRSQHSEGRSNIPATCEVCNKVYVNSRVLSVHVQSVHEGLRPYKCEYCDATYTQRGHLWRHKHASHFEKDEVQKKYASDKFSCNFDECEQTFNTKAELVEHVQTHVGNTDKPCMCNECGSTFVSQQNLAKHRKRRHTDHGTASHKGHRCEKCDKMFFTSYQLVVHFRCHTGEKPYKCDLCGKDFVQKSGLRKHIRCKRCPMVEGRPNNPRSARKYACEHCDKMFPGPSDLKAHVRTHTGEKPYQCHVCEKGFSQPGNLTKHVRFVHNKEERPKEKEREKKFFCSLCGKAFLCPSSLAMHCRTHSGDKPYTCDKCGQAFAQAGNLKKHFKRWHDEGAEARLRRRKVKGQKSTTAATQDEASDKSQENRAAQPEAVGEPVPASTPGSVPAPASAPALAPAPASAPVFVPMPVPVPSQTSVGDTTETPSDIQHGKTSQATSGADTPVTSALPSELIPSSSATLPSSQPAVSEIRQVNCTPLNTPSHFYGTTPLNTAVTSSLSAAVTSSLNVPATQRIPILFGYVTPMDTATMQSSQTSGDPMHRNIPGGPLNLPPMPSQGGNLSSLSAQELQQVVISRILAAENAENPFLPPNVSGMSANLTPRAPVLLPHVHSLLNPPGVNTSAGEVTVWPFSPNSSLFQQQYE